MPISISTFSSGAVISATDLRTRSAAIEDYVNKQIEAGDRTTNWMTSGHVYGPDFQYGGGYDAHLPLTGGHLHWSQRPNDDGRRAIFSYLTGTGPVMVPGLTRTVQIPESLASSYRAVVMASFWIYEYGGEGAAVVTTPPYQEESTLAARVALYADGVQLAATLRPVYTASAALNGVAPGATSGMIYCRKQVSMVAALGNTEWSGAGVHTVGVAVLNQTTTTDEWKHIFVREGSFYVRYRIR